MLKNKILLYNIMKCYKVHTIRGKSVIPLTPKSIYIKKDTSINNVDEMDKKVDNLTSKMKTLRLDPVKNKLKAIKIAF